MIYMFINMKELRQTLVKLLSLTARNVTP